MIQDQLDPDERLRLECLAQAVAKNASSPMQQPPAGAIVEDAKTFEKYVRGSGVKIVNNPPTPQQ